MSWSSLNGPSTAVAAVVAMATGGTRASVGCASGCLAWTGGNLRNCSLTTIGLGPTTRERSRLLEGSNQGHRRRERSTTLAHCSWSVASFDSRPANASVEEVARFIEVAEREPEGS